MKKKKIVAIILCVSIVLPTFCVGAVSFAEANPDIIQIPFLSNSPKSEMSTSKIKQTTDIAPQLEEKVISIEIPDKGTQEVYKGTRKTIGMNGVAKSIAKENTGSTDLYNLDKKDIEELLNNGYTIKQIFEADDISNRILENPKELLERSKKEHKELKDIEKKVMSERKQKQFDELKEKHPKEYSELQSEQLSENEINTLLSFCTQNNIKSIKDLAKQYKKDGDNALKKIQKTTSLSESTNVSQEKMKKYTLSESDADGLSDDIIAKLEELSKKTNKPVKELINGFKEAKNKAGGKNK